MQCAMTRGTVFQMGRLFLLSLRQVDDVYFIIVHVSAIFPVRASFQYRRGFDWETSIAASKR
jgi:hypothetical protein